MGGNEDPPVSGDDSTVWFFDDTLGDWMQIPQGYIELGEDGSADAK